MFEVELSEMLIVYFHQRAETLWILLSISTEIYRRGSQFVSIRMLTI